MTDVMTASYRVLKCRNVLRPFLYATGEVDVVEKEPTLYPVFIWFYLPPGWHHQLDDYLVFDIGDEANGQSNENLKFDIMNKWRNGLSYSADWTAAENGPGSDYKGVFSVAHMPYCGPLNPTGVTQVTDLGRKTLTDEQVELIDSHKGWDRDTLGWDERVIFFYSFILRYTKGSDTLLIDPGIGNEYK